MFKCVRFLRIRRVSRGWAANFRLFLVEIRVVRCCSDGTLVFLFCRANATFLLRTPFDAALPTKFDVVTHMESGLVFMGQPRRNPNWTWPQRSKFLGFSVHDYTL